MIQVTLGILVAILEAVYRVMLELIHRIMGLAHVLNVMLVPAATATRFTANVHVIETKTKLPALNAKRVAPDNTKMRRGRCEKVSVAT